MVFLCSNICTSEEIVCVSFVFSIHASYTYGLGFGKMIKSEKENGVKPFSMITHHTRGSPIVVNKF